MQKFVLMQPEEEIELSSIDALAKAVGFKLPASFIELYLKFNGGIPNRSWVVTDDGYEPMQISDFKPIFLMALRTQAIRGLLRGATS
jgi:hypothetical protein